MLINVIVLIVRYLCEIRMEQHKNRPSVGEGVPSWSPIQIEVKRVRNVIDHDEQISHGQSR